MNSTPPTATAALVRLAVSSMAALAVVSVTLVALVVSSDVAVCVATLLSASAAVVATLAGAEYVTALAAQLAPAPAVVSRAPTAPAVRGAASPPPPITTEDLGPTLFASALPDVRNRALLGGGWVSMDDVTKSFEIGPDENGTHEIFHMTRSGAWVREQWFDWRGRGTAMFDRVTDLHVVGALVASRYEVEAREIFGELVDTAKA